MAKSGLIRRVSIVLATLTATWVGEARPLDAMPSPMSREMTGTIQRIDDKTITILPDSEPKPLAFAWNWRRTEFLTNRVFTTVNSLRIGTHVQLRCSQPIFGPPFVYRIAWQTASASERNERLKRSGR